MLSKYLLILLNFTKFGLSNPLLILTLSFKHHGVFMHLGYLLSMFLKIGVNFRW
jgi:hypothetical protein